MINYQGSTVWVVITSANGIPDRPDIFSNQQAAIDTFSTYVRELNGDPMQIDFDQYQITIWYDDDDPSEANVSIRMYEEKVRHKE